MTKQEVFDALVQRLLASGEDQSTVAERAQTMIDNWYYFSRTRSTIAATRPAAIGWTRRSFGCSMKR